MDHKYVLALMSCINQPLDSFRIKTHCVTRVWLSIINIRWSCDHLIFIIPIPGKMVLTLKQGPGYWCCLDTDTDANMCWVWYRRIVADIMRELLDNNVTIFCMLHMPVSICNYLSSYRNSHCKSWSYFLYNGNPYTGKRASLYWNNLLDIM